MQRSKSPSLVSARLSDHGLDATLRASLRGDSTHLFLALLAIIALLYGGLSNHVPLLNTLHVTSILSYSLLALVLARYGARDLLGRPQVKILIALTILTAFSALWAVVTLYALQSIRPMVDFLIFLTVIALLIDRPARVTALSWLFTVMCVFLVAKNLPQLTSGIRSGTFDAAYFMGDGNDFAWGMLVFLPLVLYLVLGARSLSARVAGTVGLAFCVFGIIGSGSRGASLGLAASIAYYWLMISKRKMLSAMTVFALLGIALSLAPAIYIERMQSLTEYREDSSAQARLQAWKAATRMALDYPLGVGGGNFASAYGRYYIPTDVESRIAWAPGRWLSAHSIYFRALGEHGVVGLILLISTIWLNLRQNLLSQRRLITAGDAAKISPMWPALINMAIVGYATSGIFLGGISYPHLFLLTALTISSTRLATAGSFQTAIPDSRSQGHRYLKRRSASNQWQSDRNSSSEGRYRIGCPTRNLS